MNKKEEINEGCKHDMERSQYSSKLIIQHKAIDAIPRDTLLYIHANMMPINTCVTIITDILNPMLNTLVKSPLKIRTLKFLTISFVNDISKAEELIV